MLAEPDIGLQLFIGGQNAEDMETSLTGMGGMNMSVEEILEFFADVWGTDSNTRARAGFKTQDTY